MISSLASLFVTPISIVGWRHIFMLVPLSLAIAIVYKTLRIEELNKMPLAAATLAFSIIAGMYAVGVGVWLAYLLLA